MATNIEDTTGKGRTHFADPARAPATLLETQIALVASHPITSAVIQSFSGAVIIINTFRQAIAVNDHFLEALGIENPKDALGLRPGEALHCIHSEIAPSGCGTGEACRECGAVLSILASQKRREPIESECLLTRRIDGIDESLEFMIRATPLTVGDQDFTVVTLVDIGEKKRCYALERVFIHDILNCLQAIQGTSELITMETQNGDLALILQMQRLADYLAETTNAHRDMLLMEKDTYQPKPIRTTVREVFDRTQDILKYGSALQERQLVIEPTPVDVPLTVDRTLLVRVLVNMLKNALEATPPKTAARLWHAENSTDHIFRVWNQGKIPDNVARRIFQRYFSTKEGLGRGLGTYSMKLIGERYLKGAVRFTTSDDGTVFEFHLHKYSAP